jgi:hypothetical protein
MERTFETLLFHSDSIKNQPPVQWVLGVLIPGLKLGRGVTLTTHPHLVPRSIMSRSYTSSPPKPLMACSGTALVSKIKQYKKLLLHILHFSSDDRSSKVLGNVNNKPAFVFIQKYSPLQ